MRGLLLFVFVGREVRGAVVTAGLKPCPSERHRALRERVECSDWFVGLARRADKGIPGFAAE